MSLSTEENSEFARITAILKKIGKENLLQDFKEHELTDDVLDCLQTELDMRNELKSVKVSSGAAIKFSNTWFSHKTSDAVTTDAVTDENVPSTSKQSIPESAAFLECKEQRQQIKQPQNSSNLKTEEHDNKSVIPETKVASKSENKRKTQKLKENVSQEPEPNVESVESDVKTKSMETASQEKSIDVNDNIKEPKPTGSEAKKAKAQPKSNDSENRGEKSSKKKAQANRNVQEISNAKSVDRKYCNPRPFGQPDGDVQYEKGTSFCNVENEEIEFKSLTKENPLKLPWKIMEKARVFTCGVLNSGERGTIRFGIGDSLDKATSFNHGEVIGLEVENLKDEINKAFQSILDDHIKSDDGKLNSGEMKAVKIHYVQVWESNEKTSSYVVEIDVQRDWASCKDHVYYIDKWDESEKWKNSGRYGLHDLYKVKKGNDEQAYIRTCGASQSVKSSDINKLIKEPLSLKYNHWKVEDNKKMILPQFRQETANTLDTQKTSNDIRESLQKLQEEIDYTLIASKIPQQYRGLNNLSFLKSIPWFCVFDLFDQKSRTDGLYYILNETNDSARVSAKNLGDFNDPTTDLSKRVTTWILRDQLMHESDWTRYSKNCLYKALSTCYEGSLARKHWVFLCLSDECLAETADVIDLLFTILGKDANKYITIISEKKEIGEKIIKYLKDSIRKDLKYPCSFFGMPLDLLKMNVREMLGPNNFHDPKATTDLPHLGGLTAVLNKRINSLTHLEVYCPKPSLTPSVQEIKEARDDFYKGDAIQQLNLFHRHDIERTLQDKLTRQIDRRLKKLSSLYEQEYTGFVETVNLSYEPGSGATTLCRRILWDKRKTYRCAVVKTVETDTDYQINELQKFSYETGSSFIPPVLILVDKFPEQNVFRLIDKLSERKTKCVLLNTIPITNVVMGSEDDNAELSQLDDVEIERVKKILGDVEDKDDEKKRAAEERLKRERRFIWLGLELFGRQCVDIEDRLSIHIQQIISYSITNRLQDAYEMILYFCCFLDYYSKGQFIYPHSCILDILDENYGLDEECTDQIVYIHDKFGGLLLEDYSETGCYRGWRPAHFLVGEVIRKKMDLVTTVKKFFTERKNNDTYAKKNLIKNIVHTCLQRDSIYQNSPTSEDDPDLTIEEDDFGEKQKYSTLLLDAMHHTSESEVTNALDILIAINVNVETDEQKAHSSQQLARILAYEVGVKTISHKDASLLSKLSLPCIDQISNDSSASGFEVAHQVIDLAVTLQPTYAHHLVTKGTFFKTELQSKLVETNRPDFASRNLQDFVEEAINITKKGISLYNSALEKTPHDDSYLYAMIGKIQIIIILLEIFKNLPCFSVGGQRPDESFKLYMTFGKHPEELNSTLSEDDLKYFLSLRTTPSQLLDELFEATEERRKQLLKKHKMQKIKNANRRGEFLRKKFYDVTKLDRTPLANNNRVSKEDIVQDILYKHEETSYSGWKKLDQETINQIYEYSKQAIAKETTNDKVMLIYAKAALKQSNVVLDDLSEHVKNWCLKYPMSRWANLFNYMIKFPVPNGSLKANVPAVNHSIQICKSKALFPPNEYRKSSAEYFLGKGSGINAILPSHEFEDSSKKQEMKTANGGRRRDVRDTQFWRSKDVYKKLERLCGQKVLGKRGVLDYRGVEIMFDNERYPKESRDDLWFCLGFTLNGPYAYDPVDEDTFNTIKQGFSEEKKMYSDAINSRASSEKASKLATPTTSTSPLPSNSTVRLPKRPGKEMPSRARNKDAWKTNENQRKQGSSEENIVCSDATNSRVCSPKTSEKASKSGARTFSTSQLSSDFTISPKRPGKEVTSSARNKDSLETNENQRKQGFSEEDIVCSDATNSRVCSPKTSEKTSKSGAPTFSTSSSDFTISPKRPGNEVTSSERNKDAWKTNKKLTRRIHARDGHQLSLEPQKIDPKGRVIHAAQVTGAPKSVICKIPSERCSSGTCTFAHPTMDDPIRQTVCILCTKNNQDSCNKKNEHAEHIYDLGPFLNKSGEIWSQRGAYYRLDKI